MKKIILITILSIVLNTMLFSQNIFVVTKTDNPDPFDHPYNFVDSLCDTAMYGTLQWAIRKTNDAPPPSIIRFNIPGTGQHIINLNFSFPAINKQVKIDGSSQPGYNYNNGPSIIIDGANIPYNSACFNISADSSVIKGLLIQNFYLSYGIIILGHSDVKIKDNIFQNVGGWNPSLAYYRAMSVYVAALNCVIQGNIFGTDITGTVNYGSTAEAIYLQNQSQPADNCLIGGSGANEPNIVANSGWGGGWAGVSILNGKYNRISRNKIYNNPLGISLLIYAGPGWWGNEGRPSPVIDSLTPSGILYGTSQPDDIIELFGSSGPQNANEYLQSVVADASGNWNATMVNFNWPYFISTATDAANNTSELSNAYEIIIPPPMASCATATVITIDSICIPQNYLGQTTDIWFKFIPDTANVYINVSYPATAAATIDRMNVYEGDCDSLILYAQINNDTLNLYDLIPGNFYYLKLRAAQTGYFNICAQKGETIFIPPDYEIEPPAGNGAYYVNKGQIIDTYNNLRPDIKYYSVNTSPEIYLTDTAVSFVLVHIDTIAATPDTMQRVDMKLGGNSHLSRPYKREQATGYLNYYLGHCPQGVTNVNGYYRVVYPDAYPGINLQCYSNSMGAKFYFVLKPGAKSENIILKFNGADAVNIDGNGNLIIQTSLGNIEFEHAQCYKVNPAGNVVPMPNQGDYVQISPTEIGFNLQQPPGNNMPVVIMMDKGHSSFSISANDNLEWSTYYGGTSNDRFYDVATDSHGNAAVTGYTGSNLFPIVNNLFTFQGAFDAIVIKFKPNGERNYATYFGGSGMENSSGDWGGGKIAFDGMGNTYITGNTISTDLPIVTPTGAYLDSTFADPWLNYQGDIFIAKFDTNGQHLLWSAYYGGIEQELATDILVDEVGNIFITGAGDSLTPLKHEQGAFNDSINGHGLILKFNSNLQLVWATLFGSVNDSANTQYYAFGIDADKNLNKFITGHCAFNLPIKNPGGGAYVDSTFNGSGNYGCGDAYIAKFNINDSLVWSTYFGDTAIDRGYAVVTTLESPSSFYIAGGTASPNFPVHYPGAPAYIDSTYTGLGAEQGFISKFSNNGNLLWSTHYNYIAGPITALARSKYYDFYLYATASANNQTVTVPYTGFYDQTFAGGWCDALILQFDEYDSLTWAASFGGRLWDQSYGLAISSDKKLYLTGLTNTDSAANPPFPVRILPSPAWMQYDLNSSSGVEDAFIARFNLNDIIVGINPFTANENDDIIAQLYPNPGSDVLNLMITLKQKSNVDIALYNMLGEKVSDFHCGKINGKFVKQLNISYLQAGMYLIMIKANDNLISKKLIKQ